jgi:hypothetical protein
MSSRSWHAVIVSPLEEISRETALRLLSNQIGELNGNIVQIGFACAA